MYSKAILFFYSGTGNTYRVANWIGEYALTVGVNPELVPMNNADKSIIHDSDEDSIIGLLFPTHALTAPLGAIKFVLSLPSGKGKHCFIIATRGGGSITAGTPGCEGNGTYLIAAILKLKGYAVRNVCAVDMPSNWNVVHSAYGVKRVENILLRSHDKAWKVAELIFNGQKLYKGIISALFGFIFLPVSIVYIILARLYLAKLFFASNRCTGCALCAKNCPSKAVKMVGGLKSRPYWTFSCESCMRCMAYCPHKAVEASHVMLVPMIGIFYIPFSRTVWEYLRNAFSYTWMSAVIGFIFSAAVCIIISYLMQILVNIISRIKVVNKILCISTFTYLFKRYTEPETSVADMMKPTSHKSAGL